MKNIRVDFYVKNQDDLKEVESIIADFISEIKTNEPDTLMYRSFHTKDDPQQFFHIMSFKDDTAEQVHRNSTYCREFVDKLYPLCEGIPEVIVLSEVE